MSRVLVTGANGFIGPQLCQTLAATGTNIHAAVRKIAVPGTISEAGPGTVLGTVPGTVPGPVAGTGANVAWLEVGNIGADTDWNAALEGVDQVVHLASRVHVMHDAESDPLAAYRMVNVDGTLALARMAAEKGVERFVFVSSIKVNGEATTPGHAFSENSTPQPVDPYGVSKLEAEQGLRSVSEASGMQVVIVRPPLVYGPGVKANFASMMRVIYRGLPLPFGMIDNKRSLVSLDNLVHFLSICIEHPGAANRTFLVSDGEDLSTPELLRRVGKALGKPVRIVPVPVSLLKLSAKLAGRGDVAKRLLESLQVDTTSAQSVLGWTPPYSVDESLAVTARHFLEQHA